MFFAIRRKKKKARSPKMFSHFPLSSTLNLTLRFVPTQYLSVKYTFDASPEAGAVSASGIETVRR